MSRNVFGRTEVQTYYENPQMWQQVCVLTFSTCTIQTQNTSVGLLLLLRLINIIIIIIILVLPLLHLLLLRWHYNPLWTFPLLTCSSLSSLLLGLSLLLHLSISLCTQFHHLYFGRPLNRLLWGLLLNTWQLLFYCPFYWRDQSNSTDLFWQMKVRLNPQTAALILSFIALPNFHLL